MLGFACQSTFTKLLSVYLPSVDVLGPAVASTTAAAITRRTSSTGTSEAATTDIEGVAQKEAEVATKEVKCPLTAAAQTLA